MVFAVNLVNEQGLRGTADMGAAPEQPVWTAGKAIDNNTNQNYSSNSCAITDFDRNRNTSIWWTVWMKQKFNVAYMEIYFRSDSKYKYIKNACISLKISLFYCISFCNIFYSLIILILIMILKMSLLTAYMPYWLLFIITYFQAFKRSTGFSIYTYIPQNFYPLSDPKYLVYHHDPMSGCPSSVMNITVNNITQGIAFINTRPYGYTSNCPGDNTLYTGIDICEIRVMGQYCNVY